MQDAGCKEDSGLILSVLLYLLATKCTNKNNLNPQTLKPNALNPQPLSPNPTSNPSQAKHDAWNLHEDGICDVLMRLAPGQGFKDPKRTQA